MPIDSTISLSTASIIENDIQHAINDFSTIDTIGSLVNNENFKQGYNDLVQSKKTERSYIWEALSAVSQDLGQSLYQNVKNYIDNVSNVDTCKVKALRSMMSMLGSDYTLLDKISYYPIEIQNLIDILSISKKYLLNNKYIKKDFLDACVADGIMISCSPDQMLDQHVLSNLSNESLLSIDAVSSSSDYYILSSSKAFDAYLSSIYGNLMYDMLTLHGTGICADVELYKTGFLSSLYDTNTITEDKYLNQKKLLNVDVNFDVQRVVNDIEVGIDSIDNYFGGQLSLLTEEMTYRRSPASNTLSLDLATRYIYYRKQKVLEYAEFVDNMVFLPTNFSSYIEYPYNSDYLMLLNTAKHNSCISANDDGDVTIVRKYVEYAAMSLASITNYIAKIRDAIRLQTRKIFMKGTDNLLRYTANEFLIDYINSLKGSIPFEQMSSFIEKLSSHNIANVVVQEYWDLTEYMNLSTTTTRYSVNSALANDKFFDQTFERQRDKLIPSENNIFTNEQLNKFYLNDLNLANTLVPALSSPGLVADLSSNLYEFLSVIFDVAASTAYYNKDQKFGMKLPNDVITEEINADIASAYYINNFISNCVHASEFEFEESASIRQQIDDLSRKTYNLVFEESTSEISSLYNEYNLQISQLRTSMDELVLNFKTMLENEYSSYFCKSSNIYCYNTDGSYMFDYFVGNNQYSIDTSYMMSSMSAREWINDEHCYTFALSTAIESLSAIYDDCHSQITAIIHDELEKLDFIDPDTSDLDVEMDSMQDFVNSKISQRASYLQNVVQNMKDQAAQAKQSYDTINSTFSSILASMPSLPHQNFYLSACNAGEGQYRMIDPIKKDKYLKKSIYDAVSQARYVESETYGTYLSVECEYLDELAKIDETASLEDQIEECMKVFDQFGNMTFGAGTSTIKTIGTQKITLQSLKSSIYNIKNNSLMSIVNQLKDLFQIEIDISTAFNNKPCIECIEYVIQYLNTQVSDQNFNGDNVMKKYYQILSNVNDISCNKYISAKSQYEALWTQFNSFFDEYSRGADYKLFIPSNIQSIDEYRQKKDKIALNAINDRFDDLDQQYNTLLQQFIDMCNNNEIMLYSIDERKYRYIYSGSVLEICLDDLDDKLLVDIQTKEIIAAKNANAVVDEIQNCETVIQELYRKYFPYAIEWFDLAEYNDKFNALTVSFEQIINDIIEKLEYNDKFEYEYSKELFKNYSGLVGVATDPYYNLKNQTHPSYQIHPFMWNFIEYHMKGNVLKNISNMIIGLDYDMLESENVIAAIDTLLGKFGNVINVWKNNTLDFTGYSTKYEQSNHICEYTNRQSEVVGYEGAFYPPALEAYLKSTSRNVDSLNKYYAHLRIDEDPHMKNVLNNALSSSYSKIQDIAKLHLKQDIYDIYKYYVDSYGNMYILYKVYGTDDLTEQQKLAANGELWIRLADSPLAFPMSCVVDIENSSPAIGPNSGFISICDICMHKSGTKIEITGYNQEGNGKFAQTKPLYIKYDIKNPCGVGVLTLIATNPYSNKNRQTDIFPYISNNNHQRYIGSLNHSDNGVDVVYIQCDSSGNIVQNPVVYVYTVEVEEPAYSFMTSTRLSGTLNSLPVISRHDSYGTQSNSYVDILYSSDDIIDNEMLISQYKDLSAGTLSAAEGPTFGDPLHHEMNSFDLLSDKLVLKSICTNNSNDHEQSTYRLQTNTDMGYSPCYTYGQHKNILDVKHELDESHQIVELLGKSKNIEDLVKYVNSDPDPYITKRKLFDKYMYGRIYEDDGIQHINGVETSTSSFEEYDKDSLSFDQSINIYSNYSMYQNMPDQIVKNYRFNYVNGHYQWLIYLDNEYSYEKLRSLRLFIYSTTTVGKNPYVVADMSSVIDESNELAQNEFLSTNYNTSNFNVTTHAFTDGAYMMTVNGTQNGIDEVDSYFSNGLPNISNLTYKYSTVGGGSYLLLDFKIKDVNAGGYIESDIIKIALVDMFDLSFYNWYHFIDPGVTFDDCWYTLNKIKGNPLTKAQLSAIDFSQYNYLSDIQVNGMQIFNTNHKIQFKVGEEDIFNISSFNYYVPSLNVKYPMTFSQAFDSIYNVPSDILRSLVNIYQPDEVFELEVTDAEILSSLQTISLYFNDIQDEFRVYEDYFHVNSEDVANNNKYSIDDPMFYQYVHFVSQQDKSVSQNEIIIDDSMCIDTRIDGTDAFSTYINSLGIDPRKSEENVDSSTFVKDFDFSSLSTAEKRSFIENVKKFMILYFSYAKTSSGIVLYVNYQNYLNSPYVKLADGLPYMTLLDDEYTTYAKIYPDESKNIDIVLQFKQYINGILMSVENLKVATCRVYNVSDDKPKFVIERLNQLN